VSASERILVASPFSFDPSVVDVFLALSTGACLVLVHPRLKAASLPLARAVHQYRVTFMQATPSLFLRWAPAECAELVLGGASAPLRVLLLGGEPFPPLAAVRARRHPRNRTRFFNVYGVTEVSSWATIAEVKHQPSPSRSFLLALPSTNPRAMAVDFRLLSLSECLSRFHWVLLGFHWVLLGFHWLLLGFTGFYWVLLGFHWLLLGFTWFYWVLLGFIGFY